MSNITNTKNMLNESKEFPVNILKRIEKMTDENDHNGARMLLSKTIKNKKMEAAYTGIDALNAYFGHTPTSAMDIRNQIDHKMFEYVKKTYSNGQAVYMAF